MEVWAKWTWGRTYPPPFFLPPGINSAFWHLFNFFQQAQFRSCMIGKTLSKNWDIYIQVFISRCLEWVNRPPTLRHKFASMVPRPPFQKSWISPWYTQYTRMTPENFDEGGGDMMQLSSVEHIVVTDQGVKFLFFHIF